MRPDTQRRLADNYEKYPSMYAGKRVSAEEIDAAAERLGVPFSSDYREFISRYGGGHAGSLPVAGLRRWESAGNREWSVIELTEWHRAARWPGTEVWAVFSDDGFGNPVGLDAIGRIWLSDHDSCECVCLEAGFEDWVLRWALHVEERPKGGYWDRLSWPTPIIGGDKSA
ncbi:MAG: SMI1/KNR4 family protein [Planctomycetes bacterium]|nr:SMI1/KNR4 family protein [Planctomycetota bacterium]